MEKWFVFVEGGSNRGRVSWCVPESSMDVVTLKNEGHELVCTDAASEFDGWTYAAVHHGCLPNDYDDRMTPGIIWDPLPLYRSVSIPELETILENGEIRGGKNTFNGFERRPWVFFASAATPQTIGQGEDVTRLAEFKAYHSCLADGIDLTKGNEELRKRYFKLCEEERAVRAASDFSSVVLKTKPIGLGIHYSLENGATGMNGEDEFGLFPGQVKMSDVVEVLWVKNGEVVETTSTHEIEEKLEILRSQRLAVIEPDLEEEVVRFGM